MNPNKTPLILSSENNIIISDIVDYLIKYATLENGLLAKSINITDNRIENLLDNAGELGDYAQYIACAGKLIGKAEYVNYALQQVRIISEKFQRTDGIINLEPAKRLLNLGEMDLYIGMVQLYIITKEPFIKDIIDNFYFGLLRKIIKAKKIVPSQITKDLGFVVPIANPMDNGNHIELLGELYEFTQDEKYRDWMMWLSKVWLDNGNFKRHHIYKRENINIIGNIISLTADVLFDTGFFKTKIGKPSYCAKIAKQNTHLMFGLLENYKITKNIRIKKIFDSWILQVDMLFMHPSGIHYGIYDFKRKFAYRLEVIHTISLVELLITAFLVFKDPKYLVLAENYSKALTGILTIDNLLLLFPFPKDDVLDPQRESIKKEYEFYSLDTQIDFSVNLLKLHVLTNNRIYFNVAQKVLNSTLNKFKHGNCYTEMVHKNSGEKWDIVRTKYLGLMLKPFLFLEMLRKNSANDMMARIILQDR